MIREQRKKTRGYTSGSHCASLSLFLSQAFSLVSFPFTNLFLTLSLFLLVGLLKCRTAGKRRTGITARRSHDLYTVWSTGDKLIHRDIVPIYECVKNNGGNSLSNCQLVKTMSKARVKNTCNGEKQVVLLFAFPLAFW